MVIVSPFVSEEKSFPETHVTAVPDVLTVPPKAVELAMVALTRFRIPPAFVVFVIVTS